MTHVGKMNAKHIVFMQHNEHKIHIVQIGKMYTAKIPHLVIPVVYVAATSKG